MFLKEKFPILIFIILNLIYLNLTKKLNGDNKNKLSNLDKLTTDSFTKLTTNSFDKLENNIQNDSLIDSNEKLSIKLSTKRVSSLNDTLSNLKHNRSTLKIDDFYTTQINLDQTTKSLITKLDLNKSNSRTNITNSNQLNITVNSFLNQSVTNLPKTDITNSIESETTPNLIIELKKNDTISSLSNTIESKTTESFISTTDPKKIKSEEIIENSTKPELILENQFSMLNSTENELNLPGPTTKSSRSVEIKKLENKPNEKIYLISNKLENLSNEDNIDFDYGSGYYPDNNFQSGFPKGSNYQLAIARAAHKSTLKILSCRDLCAEYSSKKDGKCVKSKTKVVSPYCEENQICKCN